MNVLLKLEHVGKSYESPGGGPARDVLTDVDLEVAAGEPLSLTQDDVRTHGHAIECRINAEDPVTFRPSPGRITTFHPPGGPGIRLDTACYAEAVVPPYYDSMIAKLIVSGRDRGEALNTLRRALAEFRVQGVSTTIPFYRDMIDHGGYASGAFDTGFVDEFLGT